MYNVCLFVGVICVMRFYKKKKLGIDKIYVYLINKY